ncbi:hypothetical protein [Nonomuraea sp. NPDC050786]|uniref:hypothetical protein n=1 Tax=Nonomuraea sp. NPDC050786 TaxID=3154840 RepID=UPI00340EEB96
MPHNDRDLGRAVRQLMEYRPDQPYTAVRAELEDWLDGREETPAEAVAIMTDPANQVACEKCGWTNGMLCPECPGCGCYDGQCSGWRHREYMHPDDVAELEAAEAECPECGGDTRSGYDCHCDDE